MIDIQLMHENKDKKTTIGIPNGNTGTHLSKPDNKHSQFSTRKDHETSKIDIPRDYKNKKSESTNS